MPAGDAGLERQTCEVCREIDRLQAQVMTLVAWIRTRQHIESGSLTDEQILSAINQWAELQAQAAQPEGER